jgi:uncharacterized protein (TIGR03067 family)
MRQPAVPDQDVIDLCNSAWPDQAILNGENRMNVQWLLVAAAGLMAAGDATEEQVRAEFDRFKGAWRVTSIIAEGQATPVNMLGKMNITFKDNKFTITGIDGNAVTDTGVFGIDPTTNPRMINLAFVEGEKAGQRWYGIYDLREKTCTFAFGTGGGRPTDFQPRSGKLVEGLMRAPK